MFPGRELTVAVMGNRALGVCEIVPRGSFYDYTAKYAAGGSDHLVPAPIPRRVYEEALDIALRAHQASAAEGSAGPICATTIRQTAATAFTCSRSTHSPG